MRQSKLIRLLKSLSPDEFKRLSRLIHSPFFNTNPTQIKLYKLLKKEYPDFDSPKLTKEKVFQKLYPNRTFHYHRMGNLMSEMSRLVEEFLVQLEMENGTSKKRKTLLKALGHRNLYELFSKETEELIKTIDHLPFRDTSYYLNQLELRSNLFFHPLSDRYQLGRDYSEAMMNSLDRYFALHKLQLSALLKTRERLFSVDHSVLMIDPVIAHSAATFSKESILFAIYTNIYHLHDETVALTLFSETKRLLQKSISELRKNEQRDIVWHLINYAIGRINQGLFEFNQEALDLYKIGLQNGLLLNEGKMSEGTFINILSAAGMLKEFDWAYSFIHDNEQYLDEDIRKHIKALSISELEFRQRHFDGVINRLNGSQFSKILHQLKARNLLIKSWFELFLLDESYYELLIAQIESFEKFVKRNKELSTTKTKAYINFLSLLRKIVVYKSQLKLNEKHKTKLLERINNYKVLVGKFWLKNRVEQL